MGAPLGGGTGLAAVEAAVAETAGMFCIGDTVTIADIFVVPQLTHARRFGVDLAKLPRLTAIEAACVELPPFKLARPEVQPDAPR